MQKLNKKAKVCDKPLLVLISIDAFSFSQP